MQIRQALLSAIMNSAEGKVLSADELRQIESAMGITNGIVDENKFTAPFLRRDLKTVIDIIDNAVAGDELISKNAAALEEKGVRDSYVVNGVKDAMDDASFLKPTGVKAGVAAARALFGADFKGRTPAEMEKFIRLNLAVIRAQVQGHAHPGLKVVNYGIICPKANRVAENDGARAADRGVRFCGRA